MKGSLFVGWFVKGSFVVCLFGLFVCLFVCEETGCVCLFACSLACEGNIVS